MRISRKHLYLLLSAGLVLGWAWLLYNRSNAGTAVLHSNLVLCPFLFVTGYPCPSCGSTHAVLHLFMGQWAVAFIDNPLGYPVAGAMLVLPPWLVFDLVMRRSTFYNFYFRAEQAISRPRTAAFLIFVIIINWVWNLYKYNS